MSVGLSQAQATKAGNMLKTKGMKRRFSNAKVGNILNISRLSEYFTMRNIGDKLFHYSERELPKTVLLHCTLHGII